MKKPIRKSLSKKIRFEIFKRDGFCCQYCSAKPPKVPLEIDHIIPVINGGDNSLINLTTSCFDCNRGKGARELTLVPISTIKKIERLKIAQDQYKEFQKILSKEKKIISEQIEQVNQVYSNSFDGWELSERFKLQVKNFIQRMGIDEVLESMEIACSRISDNTKCIKYFCGICWNKIKDK